MTALLALSLTLTSAASSAGVGDTTSVVSPMTNNNEASPRTKNKGASKKPAKSKPADSPAVAASTAAPPGSAMIQYAPSYDPVTVPLVLERFEDFDRRMNSLTARFRQTVRLQDSGGVQNVDGGVEFLKPSRLKLERLTPERQTIVSDGRSLWAFNRDNNQVIRTSLEEWKRSEPLAQGLLDFGNYGGLVKRYEVSVATVAPPGRDGHRDFELLLRPRDRSSDFTLRLLLSTRDYFPYEARMQVGQITITSRFEEVRLNPPLSEALFAFTPPPGTEVFENFNPPRPAP